MDNCIFCKIIKGEIPSITVYEDNNVKAFLDISQATKGHVLVVPKKHVKDIFEYDQQKWRTCVGKFIAVYEEYYVK